MRIPARPPLVEHIFGNKLYLPKAHARGILTKEFGELYAMAIPVHLNETDEEELAKRLEGTNLVLTKRTLRNISKNEPTHYIEPGNNAYYSPRWKEIVLHVIDKHLENLFVAKKGRRWSGDEQVLYDIEDKREKIKRELGKLAMKD